MSRDSRKLRDQENSSFLSLVSTNSSSVGNSGAVALAAALSRITLCVLAVAVNLLCVPYDTSTNAILLRSAPKLLPDTNYLPFVDSERVLNAFVRWDAVYFLSIAEKGYIYEQDFAFFPGLPFFMRVLATCISFLPSTGKSLLIISGVIISNTAFLGATVILYRLGRHVLLNERLAFTAALLYTISPAGLFMSSIYTESLFAFLSFSGMLLAFRKRYYLAALIFALATCVRANGILHAGFFIWYRIIEPSKKKRSVLNRLSDIFCVAVCASLTIGPFLGLQYYAYVIFCREEPHVGRPWCTNKLPSIYSFVQREYWNNGFLNYYQLHQIPNFLIASPIFIISVFGIASYAMDDIRRFLTLGHLTKRAQHTHTTRALNLLPFTYLWLLLTLYCAAMMHVQVIVRFFTSVPSIYWFAAQMIHQDSTKRGDYGIKYTQVVPLYFLLYCLATTVLFATFLPPA